MLFRSHTMLAELRDSLLSQDRRFGIYPIWKNYKVLDESGDVDELDTRANVNALTHLIQLARFAFKRSRTLTSLLNGYTQRFNLYCGQAQRSLTDDQKELMRQIAEFVINDGALSVMDLNEVDTDLWRRGITLFGAKALEAEMRSMAQILLKAA